MHESIQLSLFAVRATQSEEALSLRIWEIKISRSVNSVKVCSIGNETFSVSMCVDARHVEIS